VAKSPSGPGTKDHKTCRVTSEEMYFVLVSSPLSIVFCLRSSPARLSVTSFSLSLDLLIEIWGGENPRDTCAKACSLMFSAQCIVNLTLGCYPSLLEFKELVTTRKPPRLGSSIPYRGNLNQLARRDKLLEVGCRGLCHPLKSLGGKSRLMLKQSSVTTVVLYRMQLSIVYHLDLQI